MAQQHLGDAGSREAAIPISNGDQQPVALVLGLTADQVARALGCSVDTVEQRALEGDLPGLKYGDRWIFPPEALRSRLSEKALAEAAERRKPVAPLAVSMKPESPAKPARKDVPLPKLPGQAPSDAAVEAEKDDLIDTAGIAALLGCSRTHVTNRVVKKAGFPRPVIRLSQKTVRWDRDQVVGWLTQPRKRQVPKKPAPAAY